MLNKDFGKLCTPAKIYFVLGLITILMALFNGFTIIGVVMKLFFIFIWTMFLGWICDKVSPMISWGLVLAPFVMMVLVAFGIMREIAMVRRLNPMRGTVLEGAETMNDTKERKEKMDPK